jgi:voltage-gated potassium channel
MHLRKQLYLILEQPRPSDRIARAWNLVIVLLIFVNVGAIIVSTMRPVEQRFRPVFRAIEAVSVVVFAAEYILRLWVITCSPKYSHPLFGRLRYALTPLALIDLLAIAPSLLATRLDLRFIRLARLFRLLRVLKLARYSQALTRVAKVVNEQKDELVSALGVIALLLVTAASLMYFAEHDAQPKAFPSIPASMWWAVMTLTTVGYGDVYPVTAAGKALAGTIALLGIGAFALPTSILGAGFLAEFHRSAADSPPPQQTCPECGAKL